MKRITYWLLSTISAVVLLFGYHTSTSGPMATSSPSAVVSPAGGSSTSSTTSGSSSTTTSGSGGTGSGSGSSGSGSTSTSGSSTGTSTGSSTATTTVTGDVASTQWGPVQLKLTMKGDTITKVTVLEYPNGNPRDAQINSYALPILISETKQASSAKIDMVSGATVTSTGYLQSLQSALDKVSA